MTEKNKMTLYELTDIATRFRRAIVTARENGAFSYKDRMIHFPRGCCDDTADLFAHHLYHKYGALSSIIDASYHDGDPNNNCGHSWQEINGIIIDLTGSQFKYNPVFLKYDKEVYVGSLDAFHKLFEVFSVKQSKGIEDLSCDCWERMFNLYETIISFIE